MVACIHRSNLQSHCIGLHTLISKGCREGKGDREGGAGAGRAISHLRTIRFYAACLHAHQNRLSSKTVRLWLSLSANRSQAHKKEEWTKAGSAKHILPEMSYLHI